MSEELKPCPFCGHEAKEATTYSGNCYSTIIWCNECNISMTKLSADFTDCKQQAIKAWNRRAE